VIWLYAVFHEAIQASKQPLLVFTGIPRGVDAFDLHGIIAVVHGCDSLCRFVRDTAGVDPLIEADLETAVSNLPDPGAPVRLAEEIVIE
jgi:hypothetical protein